MTRLCESTRELKKSLRLDVFVANRTKTNNKTLRNQFYIDVQKVVILKFEVQKIILL